MRELLTTIPETDVLVLLAPEELGGVILRLLNQRFPNPTDQFHWGNLSGELWPRSSSGPKYEANRETEVNASFVEAWSWLEAHGLVVPTPRTGSDGWRMVSRRGRTLRSEKEFADFRGGSLVPKELLHPSIVDMVWLSLLRRDFSSAIFQAMRQVEIAVREASGFNEGDHGVPMIRRAFHKENGPLTDLNAQEAEREALSALFAGAVGSYKNPHSHRNVQMDDAVEAAEIVILASHLLRIVDARRSSSTVPASSSDRSDLS
ncbi:MAG: TIGR02391 family protein [Mesorhizobium sp.]|uniref:TIGR02391 family protein n=1 Tax=Mesorhizobium sp. TaxID=1871066 RepID=UPI001205B420|nr:TIGR02391 family protein [Mesorhizobium sp.]TIR30129.1 MAG: TIGR02391 family protein [Mesorhizobium sp.]TIS21244.1 MAG: TIGR02391 family protein [Mesorhizobium sp.]